MKKSLITIAVLGAMSSAALAQSNVTIYGLLDAAVVSERGGATGSVTKLTGGVASASRLGFKGTEDLGGGLSALFVLEEGVLIDTGAQDSTGQAFNRQSYVGLSSKTAGTITLGRQYTMLYNAIQQVGDRSAPATLVPLKTCSRLPALKSAPTTPSSTRPRTSTVSPAMPCTRWANRTATTPPAVNSVWA